MKSLFYFLLLIFSLIPKGIFAKEFNFSLSAFSLKETALLSRGTSASIETSLNYRVDEDLQIHFWPGANFSSGQQASRDQLNVLANTIYVKEASIELQPITLMHLKAGALYQKEFLPGIAGQSKAFPALGIKLAPSERFAGMEILVQAAVPTSTGLATNSSELQSNSTLISASAKLNLNLADKFKSQITYSHFAFNDLTSASAFDSAYRGNTVSKQSASAYSFVYGFQGDEILLSSVWRGSFVEFSLMAGAIRNNSAPEQMNLGHFISVDPGIKINEKNLLRINLASFRVESDAMVAAFSDSTFGRTNRSGTRLGVSLEKNKYTWQLLFSRSDIIAVNAFQSADESATLNFSIKEISF